VGECKWWEDRVGLNVLKDLQRKAEFIKKEKRAVYFALFSKKGFSKDLEQKARDVQNIFLYDFSTNPD
jgi:hypothetical protein